MFPCLPRPRKRGTLHGWRPADVRLSRPALSWQNFWDICHCCHSILPPRFVNRRLFLYDKQQQHRREENLYSRSLFFGSRYNTPIGGGTLRRASVEQVPVIASAKQRRVSCSPSQNLFRLIGSRFGKARLQRAPLAEALRSPLKTSEQSRLTDLPF
jgi:hypothetical protein